ncbi:MAG TPA: hypothetical protein VFS60_12400 [Thermoanaerobaculia bacterium]|nr:hypothetical protein [Thermoanaerobaculia bacterium]
MEHLRSSPDPLQLVAVSLLLLAELLSFTMFALTAFVVLLVLYSSPRPAVGVDRWLLISMAAIFFLGARLARGRMAKVFEIYTIFMGDVEQRARTRAAAELAASSSQPGSPPSRD